MVIEKSAYWPDPRKMMVKPVKSGQIEKKSAFMPSGDYDLMPPQWTRPGATTEAWQLPKSYKDTLAWIKLYSEQDPYIYSVLKMKALYPLSRFKIVHKNKSIVTFFEQMLHSPTWDIEETLHEMSYHWQKFGEYTVCLQYDEEEKKFIKAVVYDPEVIEVKRGPLDKFFSIFLDVPTDTVKEIKRIMESKDPIDKEKARLLDDNLKQLAKSKANQKLQLDTIGKEHPYIPPEVIYTSNMGSRRGFSQVYPLLKTMLRMDKLTRAQTAVAERYWMPLEMWTCGHITGNPETDIIPDDDTLTAIKGMIQQALLTPPFSIVYTPLLKYEAIGMAGKLPPLASEFEFIENQILVGLGVNKNLILGDGPCKDLDSRALTRTGVKYYHELSMDDEIATFNSKTGNLEYQKPTKIHIQEYEGDMIYFKTQKIDDASTPNHRCWVRPIKDRKLQDWQVVEAKDVKNQSRFTLKVNWDGEKPNDFVKIGDYTLDLQEYLKLVGYFVSEGHVVNNHGGSHEIGFTQKVGNKDFIEIDSFLKSLPFNVREYFNDYDNKHIGGGKTRSLTKGRCKMWRITGKEIATYFEENFGKGAYNKYLPDWIKNLPKEYLQILLDTLMQGDGIIHKPAGRSKNAKAHYYTYCTVSRKLAEDVFEISLKCGNVPHISSKPTKNHQDRVDGIIWLVNWSEHVQEQFILSRGSRDGHLRQHTTKKHYKGVIWCVEVPNGLFISERNGRYIITGNSFSNVSTMSLQRLVMEWKTDRDRWERFLRYNIMLPIAKAHGWKTLEGGIEQYIIPEIEWEKSLDIEGENKERDFFKEMWKEGIISTKTFFGKIPRLNYEDERGFLENEKDTIFDNGKRLPKLVTKTVKETEKVGVPEINKELINVSKPVKPKAPVKPSQPKKS